LVVEAGLEIEEEGWQKLQPSADAQTRLPKVLAVGADEGPKTLLAGRRLGFVADLVNYK
jgi:hypothetical protein